MARADFSACRHQDRCGRAKPFCSTDGEQTSSLRDTVDWVVVNAGGHGFYRVRYSAELSSSLKHGLQMQLSPVERFGLVNDTWAATLAGLTSLTDYLSLIDLLRDETDVNVWTTVIGSGHHLERILDDAQCATLAKRLRALFGPAVAALRLVACDRARASWKASCAAI